MTRGQESLTMDIATELPGTSMVADGLDLPVDLPVIRATADELGAHARVLAEIDKASGGACLWKRSEA